MDQPDEKREASFVITVAIGEPNTTAPVPLLTASATANTAVTSLVLTHTSSDQAPLPLTLALDGTVTETITRASNSTHTTR